MDFDVADMMSRFERRPGGRADRGWNPLSGNPAVATGLRMLQAGMRCSIDGCRDEATALVVGGRVPICRRHVAAYGERRARRGR